MPPGDAQRVWYPEMIEGLLAAWSSAMSWDDLRELCSRMMERRRAIRHERGIRPPRLRCSRCGEVHSAEMTGISIRSALFALKAAGAVSDAQFKSLDKSWRVHRASLGPQLQTFVGGRRLNTVCEWSR